MGDFLDEILRHEGLGDYTTQLRCAHCADVFRQGGPNPTRLFKCDDCGQFPQCKECCLSHHKRTPLHVLKARLFPL
jgi:hypothetical protein